VLVIIVVVNLKGGTGKTTSAIHLAMCAFEDDLDVTVLDAEPLASAVSWADSARRREEPLPFTVQKAGGQLTKEAKALDGPGKVIIIDTPNEHKAFTHGVLAADVVVVPVSPSGIDLDRLRETIDALENLEAGLPTLSKGILLTRFSSRQNVARDALVGMGHDPDRYPIFEQRIRDLTKYKDSFGSLPRYLTEYRRVWEEIREWGRENMAMKKGTGRPADLPKPQGAQKAHDILTKPSVVRVETRPVNRIKPTAKSKDPNFQQTTLYLEIELKLKAEMKAKRARLDLSVVVNDLLRNWTLES
jgi:chromosome partitioning protein